MIALLIIAGLLVVLGFVAVGIAFSAMSDAQDVVDDLMEQKRAKYERIA